MKRSSIVILFAGSICMCAVGTGCNKTDGESVPGGSRIESAAMNMTTAGKRGGRSVPSGGWATEPGAGPREREPGAKRSRIDEERGNRTDEHQGEPATGTSRGQAPGSDIDEGRRHGSKTIGQ